MPLVADDVEVVRRVLAHVDAGTTDEGDAWREPVENYVNPARFDEELRLLRALPSVFVPSAAIPNPGDHVERTAFGVPLFAVRGRDRRARVFRNACRHRGFTLVEGAGCAAALVCRYHGWTYRLDGALAHVPHQDAFPGLDTATRGLVEVGSREVDGLIVIDALSSEPLDDSALNWLADGSPWRDKVVPAKRLIYVDSTTRAMNWKVLVEQFLEGYHIRFTHRDTFFPLQYDDLNVVEKFGPNSRITFPYRNIERLRDRPRNTWSTDARVTYLYQLFPNVMLATFPDLMLVIVIDPVDIDHSTVVIYSLVKPEVAERISRAVGLENPAAAGTFIARGAVEDNEMSAGVQRGLNSGANEFVEFGRHESAIGHFHRVLDSCLARHSGVERGHSHRVTTFR